LHRLFPCLYDTQKARKFILFVGPIYSSLSDLKEIGCKSVWLVYISPLSTHKGQ
jgi:hypothetical protein